MSDQVHTLCRSHTDDVTILKRALLLPRELYSPRRRSHLRWRDRNSILFALGLVLLLVGCARFTYDETPTSVQYDAPPRTFSPAATSTPQQDQIQDAGALPIDTDQGPPILRTEPSVVNLAIGEAQLVQVWIEIPKKLNAQQEKLLREFADTEDRSVLPESKGFFEKLVDYFRADGDGD